ncbi:diacylglycerol kinase family protein [Salinarimonas sp.]|uniref:diacylglycerol/lipid kinase family protein n=1 Tax=Salinarimonas sp. TaxID=2766526 RepID=UPI0032D9684E
MTPARTALLVHNPTAGDRPVPCEAITDALRAAGYAARAVSAKGDDLDAAFAAARTEPVDLVVVAGGDGTVAKAMARLDGAAPPLALLPLGTANNLARAIGVCRPWRDLVAGIGAAEPAAFRLGLVADGSGETPFVETVDVGALAAGLAAAGGTGLDGAAKLAHGRARLAEAVRDAPAIRVALGLDGAAPVAEDVLLAAVLNVGLSGPNLRLSAMRPGSGVLEIATLPAADRGAFLAWLEHGGDAPAPLARRRARQVTLAPPEGAALRVDDDMREARASERLAIAARAHPIAVLVPPPRRAP